LNLAEAFPERQFYWFGKIFSAALVAPVPPAKFGNAHFTGFEDDILAALNGLDIFVFPSREENQGMSLLEAAAVGLPILARNLPAYEGWLVDGKNCLIAATEDEFEVHLRALLEDEGLRQRLSAAARQLAQEESLDVQAQKMKRVYEALYAAMRAGASTSGQ
jgi:1,2-diacylglycerol-3-alpha-glucose alpha-1,2-glucosyltransferase